MCNWLIFYDCNRHACFKKMQEKKMNENQDDDKDDDHHENDDNGDTVDDDFDEDIFDKSGSKLNLKMCRSVANQKRSRKSNWKRRRKPNRKPPSGTRRCVPSIWRCNGQKNHNHVDGLTPEHSAANV